MTKFDKIAVLGGGAFGVALSNLAAKKSTKVVLWARNERVVDSINNSHRHPDQLCDIELSPKIRATTNLLEASLKASLIILAVPMNAMEEVLGAAKIEKNTTIISTAKGILSDSLELPCDIINKILSHDLAERACYLSGPSFAIELAQGLPTALTIASMGEASGKDFQKRFSSKSCRLYWSDDVIGVCVGGAMKNVIAIAAGACTGLNLGRNALAALITRGLAEISRLAQKMGAKPATMSGLAGVGDLLLSCTDDMSRNHRLGMLLARGADLKSALATIGTVVEGAKTAQAILPLIQKYNVELPISYAVYQVLYEGLKPELAISDLLEREPKEERS